MALTTSSKAGALGWSGTALSRYPVSTNPDEAILNFIVSYNALREEQQLDTFSYSFIAPL
jgi:hypothetical protein